ncbi:conjugative transposon protein TraN [Flavobacterium sp. CGRL1]
MKTNIKIISGIVMLINCALSSFAQNTAGMPLELERLEPFAIKVTYDKTCHIIFPAAIRYVDLGSEYLIAGKAEGSENVLRVKASVNGFEPETNFSVITNDGSFYSFDVHYSDRPDTLSYNLCKVRSPDEKAGAEHVFFEELGKNLPALTDQAMENIYSSNKRVLKGIGSKSFGIRFILKGIYILGGKYYFHTELSNRSTVPFEIEFINFKVADKNKAKRTVLQQRTISPIRTYRPLAEIGAGAADQNIYVLDQFTLADGKVLIIEIFEKNGGRYQSFKVKNSDLIKARMINDLHL